MLIIETLYLYLRMNFKKHAMKKQEMINTIMLEEKALWETLQKSIDLLGLEHETTQWNLTRWGVINALVKKLGL